MKEASVQNFTWEGVNDKTWLPSAHAQLSSPLAQLLPMATGKEGNDRRTFLKKYILGRLKYCGTYTGSTDILMARHAIYYTR